MKSKISLQNQFSKSGQNFFIINLKVSLWILEYSVRIADGSLNFLTITIITVDATFSNVMLFQQKIHVLNLSENSQFKIKVILLNPTFQKFNLLFCLLFHLILELFMARVVNSTFGELRGSVGGQTFSRNKGGAYVRAKVKPTDRKTIGQINNRASMGSISMIFRTLEAAAIAAWNSFASDASKFNGLRKVNTGQYTGFMAFTALNKLVDTINRRFSATEEISFDTTPSATVVNPKSNQHFEQSLVAPLKTVTGNLYFADGGPAGAPVTVYMSVASGQVTMNASIMHLTVNLSASIASATFDNLKDENGNILGLAVYCSDAVANSAYRPKNDFYNMLGILPPLNLAAPTPLTACSSFTLALGMNVAGAIRQYIPGQWVKATLVAFSQTGMQKVVGSCMIQVD